MRVFILLLGLLCTSHIKSQIVFNQLVFGDPQKQETATSLKELANGQTIILGYAGGGQPDFDQYSLSLINETGELLWTKLFGDSLNDYGLNLQLFGNSHVLICGEIKDNAGKVDAFVAMHKLDGERVWHKVIGVDSLNESYKFLEVLPDGGFICTGYITETTDTDPQNDILVTRFDSIGEVKWQKSYGFQDNDYSDAIRATPDNGFVLTADVKQFENGRTDYDIYILKIDSIGQEQWSLIIGDEREEGCQMIIVNTNGDYTVVGEQTGRSGIGFDGTIVRVSSTGELVYHKTIDGPGSDAIFSVIEVHPDTLVMAGYSNSYDISRPISGVMVVTDANGDELGRSYIGANGIDIVYEIIPNSLGGFSLAGSSTVDGISKYLFAQGSRSPSLAIQPILASDEFAVFPQPSSGKIQVYCPVKGEIRYELRALDGRLLQYGQANTAPVFSIAITEIPGTYLLTLVSQRGSNTKRIVVQ